MSFNDAPPFEPTNHLYRNSNLQWPIEATYWAINAFFATSSNAFTPIDSLYLFLRDVNDNNTQIACTGSIPVLALMSQLEEQRMLLRLESLTDDPVSSLCRSLGQCWLQLISTFCQAKNPVDSHNSRGYIILMSKLILYYMSKKF